MSDPDAPSNDGGDTITCRKGHTHAVEDMDKLGMDLICPECGAVVRPDER